MPPKPCSLPSGILRTKRHEPPGRRSSLHSTSFETRKPHHCARCSGLVDASQTNRRGASKRRLMTIVGFPGSIATLVFPVTFRLLCLHLVQVGVEAFERLLPEAAVLARPDRDLFQRLRVESADAEAPVASLLNQPRPLEVGEVLRHRLLRHAEGPREVRDRRRSARQTLEDRTASRICDGGQCCAQRIHNHMVVYQLAIVKRTAQIVISQVMTYI